MSVLQPRTNFNDKIKDVLYLCQYKEIPIKLKIKKLQNHSYNLSIIYIIVIHFKYL